MADLSQLKSQALAYYQQNRIPLRMQHVLNVMFQKNPPDPNGYVSTYFEELAMEPTITRVMAIRSMDNKGQSALIVKLFCLKRNSEQLVGESHIAIETELMDNAKVEDKEAEELSREKEVEAAINLINNEFREILVSSNPRHQQDLDDKIYQLVETQRNASKEHDEACREVDAATPQAVIEEGKKGTKKSAKGSGKKKNAQVAITPDKPQEKLHLGSSAVTALSQALCKASASISRTSLFDQLISCYGGDDYSITLPLPVITLLQSGKAALGKSNCIKEYMIVPRIDMPLSEVTASAVKFHDSMMKSLYAKGGVGAKNLNDFGALCPTLDKPEQGLDMIIEVVNQHGFEMGTDFFFMLNASARDCFDYEKGKYEVITGMLKTSDDMPDFWADISNRYPSIIGILDPIRCEENVQWNKICSNVSDHCLVMADHAYERPGLLKDANLDFCKFASSGVVMRMEGCNTVTHIVKCAKKMQDMNNTIMLADGQHTTNDTTIIDVAIASRARYVKLGAPMRGERIAKYNRLVELESELGERKAVWKPLEFPAIPPTPPTPTPEPDEEVAAED